MNKLLVTMVLFFVALNGYADCWNETPEQMSHYAYMDEDELHSGYCSCMGLYQIKMDSSNSATYVDIALMYVEQAGVMLDEAKKITRVLKKDYETEPKECKK